MKVPPSKPMILALKTAEEKIKLPESITQEEIIKFFKSKDFWMNLKQMFINYFKGKSPLENIQTLEVNHDILLLTHDYYLKFYNLIWYGWNEIFKEINVIFDLDLKEPGELLKLILCESANSWMSNKLYAKSQTLYRACKAYERQDFKTCDKFVRRIEKQTGRKFNDIDVSTRIVDLCIEIGKSSKNKYCKEKAIDFERSLQNRMTFVLRLLRKEF